MNKFDIMRQKSHECIWMNTKQILMHLYYFFVKNTIKIKWNFPGFRGGGGGGRIGLKTSIRFFTGINNTFLHSAMFHNHAYTGLCTLWGWTNKRKT